MLTVGDKFPAFRLTAVKGGPEGLEGPGKSLCRCNWEKGKDTLDPDALF